ncbi:unnamed protein product [Closterium sp. NIES-54]
MLLSVVMCRYGFRENLQAISTYLQELQRSHLLESPWIGLSVDESTDRIHGKHLIVYATYFRGTGVVNEFITLITVNRADAASLTSAVVQYLTGIGLDLQKISAISTDGASVMTGKNNGVVARLRMRIPHLASTHCVAHRCHEVRPSDASSRSCLQPSWCSKSTTMTCTRLPCRSSFSGCSICLLILPPGHHFGSGEKMTLNDFIQRHQKMDKREVKAEGVDSDGNPVKFSYTLHENPIEGQETDGDVTACFELLLNFVRAVDKELEWRMKDLEELEGCKLFRSASYVPDDAKRVENFKKWLAKLHKLYKKKLSGFDYTRAQSELWMFTSTMYTQHNNEDFHLALGNMLRDNDWQHSFPNLMKMWQAVAVLPLSTVECERGFGKQNLIKTWDRGSISDITLEHLMRCSCQRSTGDPRLILGKGYRLVVLGGYGRTDPLLNKPFYPNGLVVGILTWYQSGLGFESQCVHFGHPSAGGCQRSTGDPRLILGNGYRLVVLGGYGRIDPLLNKPFYPNEHDGEVFLLHVLLRATPTIGTCAFAHVLKMQTSRPFDGKDFFTWSLEFELMMEGAQILGFFDGSLPYPTNGTQYEKQQYTYQSMMAYTILLRNITPTQQQDIRSYRGYGNSAELAYNHLKSLYQATDSVSQSRLMAQLTTVEMKPGEKGMAYISRCRELRDKLLRCGGSISEDAFVTVIIGGLGPQWRATKAILRAHGRISEAALGAEIHAEQQGMDLQEEQHKKKTSAPEFAFHTQ